MQSAERGPRACQAVCSRSCWRRRAVDSNCCFGWVGGTRQLACLSITWPLAAVHCLRPTCVCLALALCTLAAIDTYSPALQLLSPHTPREVQEIHSILSM